MHEQSQGEGHSQAPLSKILLTVHSDVGVVRRETHERGSFAGRAVKGRPAVVSGSPRLFSAALRGQMKTGGGIKHVCLLQPFPSNGNKKKIS